MAALESPIDAFHREILTILHWSVIREEFCTRFLDTFDPTPEGLPDVSGRGRGGRGRGGNARGRGGAAENATAVLPPSEVIEEKHRFRRHCREALGKWILSQKGRDAKGLSYYFPTRQSTAQPPLSIFGQDAQSLCTTYDDQLVRDLSMKCTKSARDRAGFSDDLRQFIQVTFSLAERCYSAHDAIEEAIANAATAQPSEKRTRTEDGAGVSTAIRALVPIVSILSEAQKTTDSHRRIQGDVAEISIDVVQLQSVFREHFSVHKFNLGSLFYRNGDMNVRLTSSLTRIIVPRVAWEKLHQLYQRAGYAEGDASAFDGSVAAQFGQASGVSVEMLRCATLAYRYEGNLATGSLQLCADETLKRLLADGGYHVVDLCASPINAFQVVSSDASVDFCSAFIDTDRPFGSLGSATTVNLQSFMVQWCGKRGLPADAGKFVFTLDVPYDEDLCNMLFLKLSDDCDGGKVDPRAAFLLVLPLWWDLRFTKAPKQHLSTDKPEDVARALSSAVGYMQEGFEIPYPWPGVLAPSEWACFDAVFVKDSYSYFCTATNRLLSGVTATEVIGFEHPSRKAELEGILKAFYKL